jgi:superfamily II DNA or RNA helicase
MPEESKFYLNGESKPEKILFAHQRNAVSILHSYYKDDQFNKKLGWKPHLLVMPTGAGKTVTANSLIIPKMLEKGFKILWLAHRNILLTQAAYCMKHDFFRQCCLEDKPNRVCRIVSGSNAHLSMVSFKDDDVIISSIQSLYIGRERLSTILEGIKDSKLIVVIDEAHHTPSNSYQTVLKDIGEQVPGFRLLGLTATPTRMTDSEKAVLFKLYDNKTHQPTTLKKLISQGFLSKPIPEVVKTEIDFETVMSSQDMKHVHRFGELSERTKKKIADSKPRNLKVVDTYFENSEKYGKTIIFALNQIHCKTLTDELNREAKKRGLKGFKADYVIAGETKRTGKVIKAYGDSKIDVLVNVQILTEGVDVPSTKTVFLTRPTNSEVLLNQMVGRALRGGKVGGTDIAYIVDFEDQWGNSDGADSIIH